MDKLHSAAAKLGITLTEEHLRQFCTYYRELVLWNRRINLTAITGFEEVQVKHFLDSLTVVRALELPPDNNFSVIDVGSGAGFPGIPLKIIYPGIRLALLEATGKKAEFLAHIVRELKLEGIEVVRGRAEETAHEEKYREKFSVALSRAVAGLSSLAELALPFAEVGGLFVAQKKGDIQQEIDRAVGAMAKLGGRLKEVITVELEELVERRYLVIIEKIGPTPADYPRRPGIPVKRPLSS